MGGCVNRLFGRWRGECAHFCRMGLTIENVTKIAKSLHFLHRPMHGK